MNLVIQILEHVLAFARSYAVCCGIYSFYWSVARQWIFYLTIWSRNRVIKLCTIILICDALRAPNPLFLPSPFLDLEPFREASSPDEALEVLAAFFALLDNPLGPVLADNRWLSAGVLGLEVSGVGMGVVCVEGVFPFNGFCLLARRPGMGGGTSSCRLSELDGGVRSSIAGCGGLCKLFSAELSNSRTCWSK